MSQPTRGICAHCERAVVVKKDGTLRSHQEYHATASVQFPPTCPGAGHIPQEYEENR